MCWGRGGASWHYPLHPLLLHWDHGQPGEHCQQKHSCNCSLTLNLLSVLCIAFETVTGLDCSARLVTGSRQDYSCTPCSAGSSSLVAKQCPSRLGCILQNPLPLSPHPSPIPLVTSASQSALGSQAASARADDASTCQQPNLRITLQGCKSGKSICINGLCMWKMYATLGTSTGNTLVCQCRLAGAAQVMGAECHQATA